MIAMAKESRMTDGTALPRYDDLPPAPAGGRSAWEVFGAGDCLGRIGLQTEDTVLAAAGLVRRGAVFSLNAPQNLLTPPLFRRGAIRHTLFGRERAVGYDDAYDNYYPQASSQWDALAHVAYKRDVYYQGATADEIAEQHRNTIEHWARRGIVGRGVLLDVRGALSEAGRAYDPGSSYAISVDDLELARARAGVTFQPGDVILLYTGFLDWYQQQPDDVRLTLSDPDRLRAVGIEHTEAMARYIWDTGASGLVSDTAGLEVWPPDRSDEAAPFGFLHRMLIAQLGMAIGELWWLSDLAADCAQDGRYEFFLTSAPLNVPGGTGSPANALAIK
jgi:kynurenine formamidase